MSFRSIAFTPLVKELQERYGSRRQYQRMAQSGDEQDRLTDFEKEFISQRDSFYWANTSVTDGPTYSIAAAPGASSK